jgi:hypothetical protein
MARSYFGRWSAALLAVVALAAIMTPAPSRAAMSAQQVQKMIAEKFGVRVLKVQKGAFDGRTVFYVTVMNAGGNFNEAYQVSRLAVDAETGALVSAFRHGVSGYERSGAASRTDTPEPADNMRATPSGTR